MVVALLYELQSPFNCFTLSLSSSDSRRSNSWRATSWRHNDGDHGVMPMTKMIMEPRRWRSKELYDIGHIMSLLFDCM